MGGRPDARVIGGSRVPATTAALCNGYYGHVLEFDDTHDEAVLHAGSAAIPASFAVAGLRGGVSGKEFCEAILLGIELTCRLGVATKLNLVEGGWIYTHLLGPLRCDVAAARLVDPRPEVQCSPPASNYRLMRAADHHRRAAARATNSRAARLFRLVERDHGGGWGGGARSWRPPSADREGTPPRSATCIDQ